MSFSQSAAMNVIPLLARLVLAAAFIPAGYHKVFDDATFDSKGAARLDELGVSTTPARSAGAADTVMPWTDAAVVVRLASFIEPSPPTEAKPTPAQTPPTDDALIDTSKIELPAVKESVAPPPGAVAPVTEGGVSHTARRLHQVTLMVDGYGLPYPVLLGWLAALTELVGGSMLLIGLLSRMWGLGLAITMGVAFYLTSLGKLTTYFHLEDIGQFNTMFCQLGLFVMAMGVCLVGSGMLSLDGFIFGRPAPPSSPPAV
jgi:uncharacterized membrane protein YphA (DoxX/SURF4 family)